MISFYNLLWIIPVFFSFGFILGVVWNAYFKYEGDK